MTNQLEYITDDMVGSFVEGNALPNEIEIIIDRLDSDENLCEVLSLCFNIHYIESDVLMN